MFQRPVIARKMIVQNGLKLDISPEKVCDMIATMWSQTLQLM